MSLSNTRGRVARETGHMHLIDDSVPEEPMDRPVPFPIEEREIGNHALHRGCGVVARFARRAAAIVLTDRDTSTVGIEQDLLAVEALTG